MSRKMQLLPRWRGVLGLALALALGGLGADRLAAQVSTASVEVQVAGTDGTPLPGVTVTLRNTETGLTRVEVTGAEGTATLPALPPGTYRADIELQGFSPVTQEGVALRVGQTARVRATLSPAVTESINVSTTVPLVDVYKTDTSTNIVPEQIESLPVPDRDFQRLAFIAPGVQRERGGFRFINGGPVVGAGGNASQSTILVNGVDFTDAALGLSKIRFSQDAIGEFRVINNRYRRRDRRHGGRRAVDRHPQSGTNQIKGAAFGFYRADALRSQGALEQKKNDFSRDQYGVDARRSDRPGPRSTTSPTSSRSTRSNITLFRPAGAYASRADDLNHPFDQTPGLPAARRRTSPRPTRLGGNFVYRALPGEELPRRRRQRRVQRPEARPRQLERHPGGRDGAVERPPQRAARRKRGSASSSSRPTRTAVGEWFSSGNTLQTGANILGDLLGDGKEYELRDTSSAWSGRHRTRSRPAPRSSITRSGRGSTPSSTASSPISPTPGRSPSPISTATARPTSPTTPTATPSSSRTTGGRSRT